MAPTILCEGIELMLNCIWHITLGERVVQTEEFNKLLTTGDYFRTPWEAKKAREERENGNEQRARHDLHSTTTETCDDKREANDWKSDETDRPNDGEQRRTRARVRKKPDQGSRSRISSEIKEVSDDPSCENNQ